MLKTLEFERRRHRRFAVHPQYSHVMVRRTNGHTLEGHLHDVSVGGFLFECDGTLDSGELFEFELQLPGTQTPLRGQGSVTRTLDGHDRFGPWSTAVKFEKFETRFEAASLTRFIEQGYLVRAA
ncbi:MAG: PilZ domain-containing protein [Phycisphaerales bacterium]|nr:PilZ domain-containing protein [Phycisphaerales bacterium]